MTIFTNVFGENFSPPNPLANSWLCHSQHGASRHANKPIFPKKIEPLRNEILDTSLHVTHHAPHLSMVYMGVCRVSKGVGFFLSLVELRARSGMQRVADPRLY